MSVSSARQADPLLLSDADLRFVCELIQRRSAIVLGEDKRYHLESRLGKLASELDTSVRELIARARRGQPGLDTKIVEAVTVHETSFYRDHRPFDLLRKELLPEFLRRREQTRSLVIWSAACSTGQEPYSLAMILLEHFPVLGNLNVRIIATDISEQVLDKARAGIYSKMAVNRGMPAVMLTKYFDRKGLAWTIKPEIKRMVEFRKFNLLDTWTGPRPDIVLMRNVLIYFDLETKREILQRLRTTIAPDGALLLGTAETTWKTDDVWERVQVGNSSYFLIGE